MLVKRRVITGSDDIDSIFDDAASCGVDLIEICWSKARPSVAKMYGYEIPKLRTTSTDDFTINDSVDVKWIEGVTKCYPDANNRCWGYIYDTEANREKMENSFATGWYFIVDKKIRDEIYQRAKEGGKPTEHKESIVNVKKTPSERNAEKRASALEEQIRKQEEKMRYLQEQLEKATGEKADLSNKRVLKGVKIKDREAVVEKLKEKEGNTEDANKHTDYAA